MKLPFERDTPGSLLGYKYNNIDNCVSFNLEHFQVGCVSSCFHLSFCFSSKGIGVQKEVESIIYKRHPGTKSFKVEQMDVW